MLQLKEFLDENAHRSYPFRGPNALPTELILDMHVLISGVDPTLEYKDSLAVRTVVVSNASLTLTFASVNSGSLIDIGSVNIPLNSPHKPNSFSVATDKLLLEGSITLGYFDQRFIGTYSLETDGLLFEGCVIPVTQWCTGLRINDKLYTGIVDLQVAEGLELDIVSKGDSTTITFNLKEYSSISQTDISGTIDDYFKTIVDSESFVRSINGVKPNTEGDIEIKVGAPIKPSDLPLNVDFVFDDSYVNTLSIESTGNSTITICDVQTPFCYDESYFTIDDRSLETLRDNATELSTRIQSIENHLDALENNLNTVNVQLAKMV